MNYEYALKRSADIEGCFSIISANGKCGPKIWFIVVFCRVTFLLPSWHLQTFQGNKFSCIERLKMACKFCFKVFVLDPGVKNSFA